MKPNLRRKLDEILKRLWIDASSPVRGFHGDDVLLENRYGKISVVIHRDSVNFFDYKTEGLHSRNGNVNSYIYAALPNDTPIQTIYQGDVDLEKEYESTVDYLKHFHHSRRFMESMGFQCFTYNCFTYGELQIIDGISFSNGWLFHHGGTLYVSSTSDLKKALRNFSRTHDDFILLPDRMRDWVLENQLDER